MTSFVHEHDSHIVDRSKSWQIYTRHVVQRRHQKFCRLIEMCSRNIGWVGSLSLILSYLQISILNSNFLQSKLIELGLSFDQFYDKLSKKDTSHDYKIWQWTFRHNLAIFLRWHDEINGVFIVDWLEWRGSSSNASSRNETCFNHNFSLINCSEDENVSLS